MELTIPESFANILGRDSILDGSVKLSIAEFEPWIRLSGTPFFPEYTDHGVTHIRDVIKTASAIIRDNAWDVITPGDVAVLILAILLHDCAMHLTEDGFLALIDPLPAKRMIDGTSDPPWPELWTDFLAEASRFDARKLHSLFGDTEPAHTPAMDFKQWTSRDKLLIGEFLRRHHPRLAHEVALWGVPGPTANPLRLKSVAEDIADLAGLVARSHGQSIRSSFHYLVRKYDIREYKGIHPVFLMTVVRTADYLQVHSDRAPQQVLRVRNLTSPVSRGEWRAHDAVRDIRNTHEDPEAIFIDAKPADVKTFLKLENLLEGIQEELDASWAALGEVYGRYDGLNPLGLVLRRVRSNLDDVAEFAKSVRYVPCRAAFEAADADLLKLLIRPLYGDKPEIGIRELLQNAVDACRELRDTLQQRPDLSAPDQGHLEADVVITIQEEEGKKPGWVEVADRGIGMTADVVREYFLKAGASFRNSDAWRRSHEDDSGKSRVLRSGRFGIGVLASFLLGSEVEVSTRHLEAGPNEGIAFKATIDSTEIELLRANRPVGTTVRIKVSDENLWEALTSFKHDWKEAREARLRSWDWYYLTEPRVTKAYTREKRTEVVQQQFSLPSPQSTMPTSWHRITHPDYLDIHWTYEKAPRLACNGIRVIQSQNPDPYYYSTDAINPLWQAQGLTLTCPNVSVFDPDGHLPLLLERTGLAAGKYPFHEALLRDVVKHLLAFVLLNAPSQALTHDSRNRSYSNLYPGFRTRSLWRTTFCLPGGTSFVDPWHLRTSRSARFLLIPSLEEVPEILTEPEMMVPDTLIPFDGLGGTQSFRAWFRCNLGMHSDDLFGPVTHLNRKGCRMLIRESTLKELRHPGLISKFYWPWIKEEFKENGWVLVRAGDCPQSGLRFERLAESAKSGAEGLAEWYLQGDATEAPDANLSPIAMAWREIIGEPVIPFDPDQRKLKLARAFEALKPYIAGLEELRRLKQKDAENDD